MGGYEHFWSDRCCRPTRSTAWRRSPDEDVLRRRRSTSDLDYGAINLLYWFLPDRAWAGVEYLYGRREVFGGDVGDANRLQFAVRFNFP